MRKRYIAITMGLVLGLSVLGGCGKNSSKYGRKSILVTAVL